MKIKNNKYNQQEERYKYEVEKTGEYEYIRSYRKGDRLPNGKVVGDSPYIQIKHKYCGSVYELQSAHFINRGIRCGKCCQKYENSFVYYIEKILGEPIEKYWDFDKNTVNPYLINRSSGQKVWIKCTEKDYHGSYEVRCTDFIKGNRCSYCAKKKVHPKDSFAQHHIDNTDKDFIEKYWSDRNTIDPWSIAPNSFKKVWIKCQEKDYHNSYIVKCNDFSKGNRCPYCNTFASKKVHPLDSFGYHNFDKLASWHPDNDISPFRVAKSSNKKYKFICYECDHEWLVSPNRVSAGVWCPKCSKSKGEKKIYRYLISNSINFINDEEYFEDLLGVGGNPLRPDFILPDHKIWIEYDGEFHYENMTGRLSIVEEHDRRKNIYAEENNWKLIRIPYWEFDNIEEILNRQIFNN